MAANEVDSQPARDAKTEDHESRTDEAFAVYCSESEDEVQRSGVTLNPNATAQTCKFAPGEQVTMTILQSGNRFKGTFLVHQGRYNANGRFCEYQLNNIYDSSLFNKGEWVRERALKS